MPSLYKNQNASLALHPLFSIPSQLGKMCRGAMVEPRDSAGQDSVVSLHYHRRCRCICCLIVEEQQPYYVRRVVCFCRSGKTSLGTNVSMCWSQLLRMCVGCRGIPEPMISSTVVCGNITVDPKTS